jgi:preprotein translocase subunit SecF
MIDILGKRYIFFAVSLAIIIPGVILMAIWGLPFSIDFKGGSLLEAQFASGKTPDPDQVRGVYTRLGIGDTQISTSGADVLVIRSSAMDDATRVQVLNELSTQFNDTVTARSFDSVGPSVSQEVTNRAGLAILASSLALLFFLWYSFRGIDHAYRYGMSMVIALFHDILIILSVVVVGGHFFGWQIDTLFLTALLTVIAFSAQDTIVIFDRLRENYSVLRKLDYEKLTNHSVVQSITRSLNTQLMTVDFLLLSLALFGGTTLREFAIVLLIGMFSGSYSSLCIAAPILVIWEKQEWRNWFKPKTVQPA